MTAPFFRPTKAMAMPADTKTTAARTYISLFSDVAIAALTPAGLPGERPGSASAFGMKKLATKMALSKLRKGAPAGDRGGYGHINPAIPRCCTLTNYQ